MIKKTCYFIKILMFYFFLISHSSAVIPVTDALANAQMKIDAIKEAAHWLKELQQASYRLQQLKKQTQSMTGVRNIVKPIIEENEKQILTESLDDFLNSDYEDKFPELTKKYLSENNPCNLLKTENDKSFCNKDRISNIATLAHLDHANDAINEKMNRITQLSNKISSSSDIKEISDLQAAISNETNSISLLQQQTDNFIKIQDAKSKLNQKRREENYRKEALEAIEAADTPLFYDHNDSNLENILNL